MLNMLSEAVVYSLRGPGRGGARGLSFCYPTDFSAEEMDIYARNFPMPSYLTYLDSICSWEVPGWVYENMEPLPVIDSLEAFRLKGSKRMSESGMPGLDMSSSLGIIDYVYYRLYRLDPETGEVVRLGRTDCGVEWGSENNYMLFTATDPRHWPAVDGQLFCMDMIQRGSENKLYNVPVQLNFENCVLRCGRAVSYSADSGERRSEYTIYGLWQGYEEHSELMNRSVKPLSEYVGREYRFLYPVEGRNNSGSVGYRTSQPMIMYRSLDVQEITLPEGTYYLEYEVDDMFMRPYVLDRIEFRWDGENMIFPEDLSWEGEIILNDETGKRP